MTDTIDFDVRGTESVTNKLKVMGNQTESVGRSFEKLNRAAAGGKLRQLGIATSGKSGGSQFAGLAQMVVIQHIASKLFNIFGNENLKISNRFLKKAGILFERKMQDIFFSSRDSILVSRMYKGLRMSSVAGIMTANGRSMFGMPGIGLRGALLGGGLLAGAAITPALLDRRVTEMLSKFTTKISKGVEVAMKGIGTVIVYLQDKMASIFNNAYYTSSKVNEVEAALVAMHKRDVYIEKERVRLLENNIGTSGAIVQVKELKEFFLKKDKERNKEISGILDMMRMEGRI